MRKRIHKILVTGGAGFIGSAFVRQLLAGKQRVKLIVVDKLTYAGDLKRLDSVRGKFKFYKADISAKPAIQKIFKKERPETVVNFAAESITVSFWFNTKAIEAGDCVLQTYNGSTWNTWYDLTSYPTYVNNVWCQFSEVTTDSQYFISNFRVRFDSLVLGSDGNEQTNIDDVLIAINQ